MSISEVLWMAANEHLSEEETGECSYICHAIRNAQRLAWLVTACQDEDPAIAFLLDLGMHGGGDGFVLFDDADDRSFIDAPQQVRYAWLMFASMYAAELESKGEL